ncbi:MAG: hypothetical protein SGILL_001588 [Bacillariaceae sp.]
MPLHIFLSNRTPQKTIKIMMKIAPAVLLVLALTTNTVNAQDCTATADCDETSFCSAGVCSPKGSCGSDTDCMNPDNLYAVAACVGVVSCLEGQCGITCGPSFCPEGVEEVECETDPCLDFKFGCFAAESCASSSCGECSAVLFDQAGNVLVPEEDCNVPAEAGCASNADCGEGAFCASGKCLATGLCDSGTDCTNPSNIFAMVDCVGVMSCQEGACSMECGPSFCEEGVEEVECEGDPCLDFKFGCFSAESCAVNTCGECSAILYGQDGSVLVPEEDCNVPSEVGCVSNADCGEGSFCASGKCMATGMCDSDTDCTNPSNIFAMVDCVGVMSCQEGACSMECGPSFCEEGVEEVECEGDPCLDFQFGCFAAESCAVNTCGECSAILYGQDGSVLVPEQDCNVPAEVAPKCGSNADCAGAMADNTDGYCAAGECLEMASCSVTNDCKNPNNVFAMIECVGVLSCDDGRCGIECGPSFCEEGVEQVNCVADPCLDFKFGCPAAESCVANTCGDCSPILFDQAGNDMGADCEMPVATDFIDTEDTCMSDSDCDEDGYCADGGCLAKGQCNERM